MVSIPQVCPAKRGKVGNRPPGVLRARWSPWRPHGSQCARWRHQVRFCRSGTTIHPRRSWSSDTSAREDCVATRLAPRCG
jgi:hypothetical protein